MNLSDMAGRKQAPEGKSPLDKRTDFNSPLDKRTGFMNMRKVQPSESLTEKLLSAQASHAAEYEDSEHREISVVLVKQEATNPPMS